MSDWLQVMADTVADVAASVAGITSPPNYDTDAVRHLIYIARTNLLQDVAQKLDVAQTTGTSETLQKLAEAANNIQPVVVLIRGDYDSHAATDEGPKEALLSTLFNGFKAAESRVQDELNEVGNLQARLVEIENTAIPSIKSTISNMKSSIGAQLATLQSQITTDTAALRVLTASVTTQAQAVATLAKKLRSDEEASHTSDILTDIFLPLETLINGGALDPAGLHGEIHDAVKLLNDGKAQLAEARDKLTNMETQKQGLDAHLADCQSVESELPGLDNLVNSTQAQGVDIQMRAVKLKDASSALVLRVAKVAGDATVIKVAYTKEELSTFLLELCGDLWAADAARFGETAKEFGQEIVAKYEPLPETVSEAYETFLKGPASA